jgi:DNA processing protein
MTTKVGRRRRRYGGARPFFVRHGCHSGPPTRGSSRQDGWLNVDPRTAVALSLLPRGLGSVVVAGLRSAGDADLGASLATAGIPWSALERLRPAADRALDRGRAMGLTTLPWTHPGYPALLLAIPDPPPLLWVAGAPAALRGPGVALVGSRAASAYGRDVARALGTDLAGAGVLVVSGLARGVDASAHAGALAAAGPTVAVLGCGADVVYPAEHRDLRDAIVAGGGAVVSELVPGTPPRPWHFPRRNRLISGLVRIVVVVEASERSGSLITAGWALDQGREVMAVPGSVLAGRNRGAHALLRDGASPVESAADVLAALGLGAVGGRSDTLSGLPTAPVLAVLEPGEVCGLETLCQRTGRDVAALLAQLLELEVAGWIRREGGGFVRAR